MNEIGCPLSFARQDICCGVRSPIASLYILCIGLRLDRMKSTVDIEVSFPVTHPSPPRRLTLAVYPATVTPALSTRRAAGLSLGSLPSRSEEHTSELQSLTNLVCRLL